MTRDLDTLWGIALGVVELSRARYMDVIHDMALQKKSKLETDNSVSNPSGNGISDGLETEFSVFKTLVSNCVRLNSVSN